MIVCMISYLRVVETLNCASMSLLTFNAYIPEYMRARFNAGLIFDMIRQRPQIDSSSEAGHRFVSTSYHSRSAVIFRLLNLRFEEYRS